MDNSALFVDLPMSMRPDRPDDDHYPTPREVTRSLLSVERFPGGIWEPCAGYGDMAAVLAESGEDIKATTIDKGDRQNGDVHVLGGRDFLQEEYLCRENIVTNPPFKYAEAILRHAITLGPAKIALLLRLAFLESNGRATGLFQEHPPTRIYVMADRITMYPADYDGPRKQGEIAFGWFIWDWPFRPAPPTIAGWLYSKDFRRSEDG